MKNITTLIFIFLAVVALSGQNQQNSKSALRNICEDETQDDYQKSVLEYKSVIGLDSANLYAHYKLGMSFYKLQKYEKALNIFDILIIQDSCYNMTLHNRAVIKYLLKDKDGACSDFERALRCKGSNRRDTKNIYRDLCKT